MELNLRKPIVFFDLETTGINITHDRIVEISIVKIMPNGEKIERTRRVNPEMPIPAEATAIHHITDEDVAGEPTFRQLAKSLAAVFTGCDVAGYNSNRFDIPMLDQEFRRAGVDFDFSSARFIDVQTIFHKRSSVRLRPHTVFIAILNWKALIPLLPTHGPHMRCSKRSSTVIRTCQTTWKSSVNTLATTVMSIL